VDQETAQMLAPAFGYAHQDLPIAAGELARGPIRSRQQDVVRF
jgi:hypothetical protein